MRTVPALRWARAILAAIAALLAAFLAAPVFAETLQSRSLDINRSGTPASYVSVANKTGLEGLTQFTIEAWVYPTSRSDYLTIVGNNFANSFRLGITPSGHLEFSPGSGGFVDSPSLVPLNQWTHVAASYDGDAGKVRLYRNGILDIQTSGYPGNNGSDAGDLRIGADRSLGSPASFWQGYLDAVRIWDVARTTEIHEDLYLPTPTRDAILGSSYVHLVAAWSFDSALDGLRSRPGTAVGPIAYERAIRPQIWSATALSLASASDYVSMDLDLWGFDFTPGITLAMWVFPTASGTYATLFGRNYETGPWLGLTPDLRLSFYPRGGVGQYVDGIQSIPLNQWSHVAAVYRDGQTRLYINGALDATFTTITGNIVSNGRDLFLGVDNNATGSPDFPFAGRIGFASVTAGPLNLDAIRHNMFAPHTQQTAFDEDAILRTHALFPADPSARSFDLGVVHGAGARYVQSGQTQADYLVEPLLGAGCTAPHVFLKETFLQHTNVAVSGAPVEIEDALVFPIDELIGQIQVFVNLHYDRGEVLYGEDALTVRLLEPEPGTASVLLFSAGQVPARDLFAQFDDASLATIDTARPPYLRCVQPRENLFAALYAHPALGKWRLQISSNGASVAHCQLHSWGLRITDQAITAVPSAPRPRGALAFAGPHPFADRGRLRYTLAAAARVRLAIFDVSGRRLATLDEGERAAGPHEIDWRTAAVASGVYLARLEVPGRRTENLHLLVVR